MINKIVFGMVFFCIFALCYSSGGQTDTSVRVLMKTTKGDITLELYPDKTPITVANFLSYVDDKFYDGTIFHRPFPDFTIGTA